MRANDDEEGIDAVASSRGHCVSPVCSTRSDVGIHGSSGVLNLAATLPRPFFPPFLAGENPLPPREEKGPLCPELRARNRAPAARKFLPKNSRTSPLSRVRLETEETRLEIFQAYR